MEFRQLEYFRVVVEAGSVSRAAKRLHLTQPPLSTAISRLEKELGVQLLERTAKGVVPTAAGLHLLAEGGQLLAQRDRLVRRLALMGDGAIGELRVGVEPMVVNELIAEVVGAFVDAVPGVHVSLTDAAPDALLQGVRTGELDIACVPFGPDQFADFVTEFCDYERLGRMPVQLAVPTARRRERHDGARGWGRWVVPYRLSAFSGFPEAIEAALADDPTFDTIEVSTPQTAVGFVAAGLGVALVTERMAKANPDVAALWAPDWVPDMGVSLLWRRGAEVTPLMARWVEASREVARSRLVEVDSYTTANTPDDESE
ncbi:LysR family transcriptional regulator [Nocardioides sp. cx-169]|uniref:LysR family transcriptional regulator n=1 Tax=Nocardioides sp. cx-169 TaxID=2899080 RepID=UPI001E44F4BE|nr:LysR family transcriptional regulator [Nocardioides sp. cx-169]MCD4533685.1 LysR family transcriptional regulator [Nocardioides sp. cx-169]